MLCFIASLKLEDALIQAGESPPDMENIFHYFPPYRLKRNIEKINDYLGISVTGAAVLACAGATSRWARRGGIAPTALEAACGHETHDLLVFTVWTRDVVITSDYKAFKFVIASLALVLVNRHLFSLLRHYPPSSPSITAAASRGNMISWWPTRE